MRFYSIVSGISYEVTPDDYEYNGPNLRNRRVVRGISAKFHNHMYDSVEAQKANRWPDDVREMVEDYLLNHENFNTQWLQTVPETDGEAKAKEFSETKICVSRTVTDEGVVDCDKEALEGEFYCKAHMPALEPVKS